MSKKEIVSAIKFELMPLTKSKKQRLMKLQEEFKRCYDLTASKLPSLIQVAGNRETKGKKQKRRNGLQAILNQWRKDLKSPLYAQITQEALTLASDNYKTMLSQALEFGSNDIKFLDYDKYIRSYYNKKGKNKWKKYPTLKAKIIRFHNQAWNFKKYGKTWYVEIPAEKNCKTYEKILLPIKQSEWYNYIIEKYSKIGFGAGQLNVEKEYFMTTIKYHIEFEEYEPQTFIGIDLGINNIATIVTLNGKGKVKEVKLFDGKAIRNKRVRYAKYRSKLQKLKKIKKVRQMENKESNWMKNINHEISKQIVKIAKNHSKPIIILEELHRFNPKLTWNFYQLRQMIEYKALKQNIIVATVNPMNSSNTCNKCGYTDKENRKGINFKCLKCGYQINADVNASINLALKYMAENGIINLAQRYMRSAEADVAQPNEPPNEPQICRCRQMTFDD